MAVVLSREASASNQPREELPTHPVIATGSPGHRQPTTTTMAKRARSFSPCTTALLPVSQMARLPVPVFSMGPGEESTGLCMAWGDSAGSHSGWRALAGMQGTALGCAGCEKGHTMGRQNTRNLPKTLSEVLPRYVNNSVDMLVQSVLRTKKPKRG